MPTRPTPELDAAAYEAWQRLGGEATLGSKRDAALEIGIPYATFCSRVKRHEARVSQDPGIQEAMAAVNTGMVPQLAWLKTKDENGNGVSVLLKPDQVESTVEHFRDAFTDIPAAEPYDAPAHILPDLCTVYPLMDVHFGMHAWGRETGGDNYDMKSAASDMGYAFAKLEKYTPESQKAVLLIGGDFFHADDNRAETPQSKHKLDTDGRHWKVLRDGVALIAQTIDRLSTKHAEVLVRVLRGNHDEHAHMVLTFALAERYRDSDRIEIEQNPRDLFIMQWGKCLISAHHGDKAKPQQLAMYLSDVCEFWSATRHRHCFTGHVHHDQAKDLGPLRWESLRAFCPPDSYAASMGYGGRRALQSITFDRNDGLVLRALDPIERQNDEARRAV